MRVTKFVEMSQEVTVDIGREEIQCALAEAFNDVEGARALLGAINTCAQFLRAITDERLAEMTVSQRKLISEFLADQAARFKPV